MKKSLSKFLCLILRHKPEVIDLTIDENGWALVDDLIAGVNRTSNKKDITRVDIDQLVSTDGKNRYAISEDGLKIRASQGHTFTIDLKLEEKIPPKLLYHGTIEGKDVLIRESGLLPMGRHHVHLSDNFDTAVQVGGRRGKPFVYVIDTVAMMKAGLQFFQSENGVWLVDHVEPCYLVSAMDNEGNRFFPTKNGWVVGYEVNEDTKNGQKRNYCT